MTESWVSAEVCTLPTAERPVRRAEFDGLFTEHLQSIDPVGPQETRLSLVGGEGLAAVVQDLVDRESACCSFFEFSVSAAPVPAGRETVRLGIRVPAERADILAALTGRALSAMGRRDDR